MADFRLLEDGTSKRLLEDGTSFRLLEPPPVTPTATASSGVILTTQHSSISFNANIPVGTNFVAIAITCANPSNRTITSVTVGGVSATQAGSINVLFAGSRVIQAGYGLVAPSTGASVAVVVTYSANAGSSHVVLRPYSNVNQTTPTEGWFASGFTTEFNGVKSYAPTTTTVGGDYLYGNFMSQDGAGNVASLDNELVESVISNEGFSNNTADQLITGAGATLDWTNGQFTPPSGFVFVIKAAADASGGSSTVSIAATQAANTALVNVNVRNNVAIAATQAANTAALTVAQNNNANIAATQAANTTALTVTPNNNVAIAATQAGNTAALTVAPNNNVAIAATQAGNTAVLTVNNTASTTVNISASQAANTVVLNVNPFNNANIAATQAGNTAVLAISQNNNVVIAASQAANAALVNVNVRNNVAIAATQAANTAVLAVTQNNSLAIAATQAGNTVALAVTPRNNVAIAATQAANTAAITVISPLLASITATQDNNIVALLVSVSGSPVNTGAPMFNLRRYPRR